MRTGMQHKHNAVLEAKYETRHIVCSVYAFCTSTVTCSTHHTSFYQASCVWNLSLVKILLRRCNCRRNIDEITGTHCACNILL